MTCIKGNKNGNSYPVPIGLVFKAHRLLCHSTLGSKVIKKKSKGSGTYSVLDFRKLRDFDDFKSNLSVKCMHYMAQVAIVSHKVSLKSFCRTQFPHKLVNLSSAVTKINKKVDEFV